MSQNELVRWAMDKQRLAESGLPNLEKQGCAIGYPEGPKGVKGEEGADWSRRVADPYGRWSGGRELEPPAYPILPLFLICWCRAEDAPQSIL